MKILVTAGPTREPLDPVRYLTNRSSGKMGYAIADAFVHAGHKVLLVSGPTELDVPAGVDFIRIGTADEMWRVVSSHAGKMDIAVFVAAVADYTPVTVETRKIKKQDEVIHLELRKTRDVLGSARDVFGFAGTLVGFAAETEDLEENARAKLLSKGCDLVVANDVSRRDVGFDADENEVLLVYPGHTDRLPVSSKTELAHELVESILDLHRAKSQ